MYMCHSLTQNRDIRVSVTIEGRYRPVANGNHASPDRTGPVFVFHRLISPLVAGCLDYKCFS